MTRKTLLVIGGITAVIIAFVLFSSHGIIARYTLSAESSTLQEELQTLRLTEDSLRTAITILENDTIEIERLARERYGYVKPGEHVYIIDQQDDDNER